MSTYLEVDRIKYLSSDNQWHPLCWLQFCRYCAQLRSLDSLSHEVDSRFCSNCLETMANGGEMMRKNKCVNCFDCPSCGNVLSTRASNVTLTSTTEAAGDSSGGGSTSTTPDAKGGASKKVFYLACGFCRWSSRDVGIPDQTVASGAWPEQENPHERRISDLMAYYRYLAAMEKAEKDRRKSPRKRVGTQLLQDKYGLTSVVAKRRAGGLSAAMANMNVGSSRHGSPGAEDPAGKKPEVARVEAKSEVEPLPPDIYTLPLNLSQVCTMKQRLAAPDVQPISRSQLHPLRKHLQVKRSLRCKECDHYVLKPEYNAASIKFKICCTATHHVPEVRIKHLPALSVEKTSEVIITITNPVERQIQCALVPLNLPEDESPTTSSITLPSTDVTLSPKDEAGEYDLASSATNVATNPDAAPGQNPEVVFTKGNKIGLAVHVTPSKSAIDRKGRVVAGFCLKYEYRNLSAMQLKSEQGKEPETMTLEIPVMLDLGMLSESYA